MFKRSWKTALSLVALGLGLVACANLSTREIMVVTREAGSGTRGSFTDLTGILVVTSEKSIDRTTKEAVVQNSTEGVISTVAGNRNGIGYISLGNVNDSVKTLQIDGVQASVQAIRAGDYAIQRPFNIAWRATNPLTKDFIDFVLSKQGQTIVEEFGYVAASQDLGSYQASEQIGSISIVGSTSVAPLMEKLIEAYRTLHPNVTIHLTANGSSAGMTAVMEKTADIGMTSRTLTKAEMEQLEYTPIALDGIVIIVNHQNSLTNMTLEQVQAIFSGEVNDWDQVDAY